MRFDFVSFFMVYSLRYPSTFVPKNTSAGTEGVCKKRRTKAREEKIKIILGRSVEKNLQCTFSEQDSGNTVVTLLEIK